MRHSTASDRGWPLRARVDVLLTGAAKHTRGAQGAHAPQARANHTAGAYPPRRQAAASTHSAASQAARGSPFGPESHTVPVSDIEAAHAALSGRVGSTSSRSRTQVESSTPGSPTQTARPRPAAHAPAPIAECVQPQERGRLPRHHAAPRQTALPRRDPTHLRLLVTRLAED